MIVFFFLLAYCFAVICVCSFSFGFSCGCFFFGWCFVFFFWICKFRLLGFCLVVSVCERLVSIVFGLFILVVFYWIS